MHGIEKLVVSAGMADKLEKAGVMQKSIFHYGYMEDAVNGEHLVPGKFYNPVGNLSAFTVTELAYAIGPLPCAVAMFPASTLGKDNMKLHKTPYWVYMKLSSMQPCGSHADAYATWLLDLLERGKIDIDTVNTNLLILNHGL